jgi:threonine dehydrogenase-like Zn-dependent dehydrogenase
MISLTGTDVAGEVVKVGSQVKDFKAGDKVIANLSPKVLISFYHLCFFKCEFQNNFMNGMVLYSIESILRSITLKKR